MNCKNHCFWLEVLRRTHVAVSVRNNSEVSVMIPAMRSSAADRSEWEEPPGAGVAFLCALMRFSASSFISNHSRLTSWVVLWTEEIGGVDSLCEPPSNPLIFLSQSHHYPQRKIIAFFLTPLHPRSLWSEKFFFLSLSLHFFVCAMATGWPNARKHRILYGAQWLSMGGVAWRLLTSSRFSSDWPCGFDRIEGFLWCLWVQCRF